MDDLSPFCLVLGRFVTILFWDISSTHCDISDLWHKWLVTNRLWFVAGCLQNDTSSSSSTRLVVGPTTSTNCYLGLGLLQATYLLSYLGLLLSILHDRRHWPQWSDQRVVKGVGHLDHVWSYGVREVVSSIPDRGNIVGWVFHPDQVTGKGFLIWTCLSFKILNLFRTLSSWGSSNYRPSAPFLYDVASHDHVKNCHSGHYYYYYY